MPSPFPREKTRGWVQRAAPPPKWAGGEVSLPGAHDFVFPSPTRHKQRWQKVISSNDWLKIPVTPSIFALGLRFNLFILLRRLFSFQSGAGRTATGNHFWVGFL